MSGEDYLHGDDIWECMGNCLVYSGLNYLPDRDQYFSLVSHIQRFEQQQQSHIQVFPSKGGYPEHVSILVVIIFIRKPVGSFIFISSFVQAVVVTRFAVHPRGVSGDHEELQEPKLNLP
ncbi:hypothetical protein M426DRAFT_92640 [Hypoxylon sp. CI-4A]|nr:hypothetical protein M426DRAFT_92640 [Hypoxylon sp. CI-4A]